MKCAGSAHYTDARAREAGPTPPRLARAWARPRARVGAREVRSASTITITAITITAIIIITIVTITITITITITAITAIITTYECSP